MNGEDERPRTIQCSSELKQEQMVLYAVTVAELQNVTYEHTPLEGKYIVFIRHKMLILLMIYVQYI